jgi:hypothetical protein
METKFTRGPWVAIPTFRTQFDIVCGPSLIASVKNILEVEANAKLIAAAPEMFTALALTRERLSVLLNYSSEKISVAEAYKLIYGYNEVNNSIEKALGLSK